jgi:long-subunit fatty acid transport protein
MGEVALSFGGNFGNALYIGTTIGIPRLNYEMERAYTESDTQDSISNFGSFTKTDYLRATGNGFNLKFGMIYRPVKWLRLGAAIHSPTWFDIDEEFTSVITSNLEGAGQYTQSTVQGAFDYSLNTPFRAIGSLAFVIGKVGLISADYEYVNYSLAKLKSRNYSFDSENASVKNQLHWAGNIRIGTEWRINAFSIRGGFGINGDPFTGAFNFDNTRYSLGAGYRLKRFFVDLSYSLHRTVSAYEMYSSAMVPLAETVTLENSVITTVGFRF